MQNIPLNSTKLNALIKQCKHFNEFPIFLSHYFPKAQSHPISDLLDDLVKECVSYLSIMTDDELDSLVNALPPNTKIANRSQGGNGNR
jgi:hypothetical protein